MHTVLVMFSQQLGFKARRCRKSLEEVWSSASIMVLLSHTGLKRIWRHLMQRHCTRRTIVVWHQSSARATESRRLPLNYPCIPNGIYRPPKGTSKRKTIIAAILKGRSKLKCSKLATLKGPSEWRISRGTTDGHFGLPWSFGQNLCMLMAPPCGRDDNAEGHIKKTVVLSPTPFNPSKFSLRRVNPLKG